jgi:hypothetical protein
MIKVTNKGGGKKNSLSSSCHIMLFTPFPLDFFAQKKKLFSFFNSKISFFNFIQTQIKPSIFLFFGQTTKYDQKQQEPVDKFIFLILCASISNLKKKHSTLYSTMNRPR